MTDEEFERKLDEIEDELTARCADDPPPLFVLDAIGPDFLSDKYDLELSVIGQEAACVICGDLYKLTAKVHRNGVLRHYPYVPGIMWVRPRRSKMEYGFTVCRKCELEFYEVFETRIDDIRRQKWEQILRAKSLLKQARKLSKIA